MPLLGFRIHAGLLTSKYSYLWFVAVGFALVTFFVSLANLVSFSPRGVFLLGGIIVV